MGPRLVLRFSDKTQQLANGEMQTQFPECRSYSLVTISAELPLLEFKWRNKGQKQNKIIGEYIVGRRLRNVEIKKGPANIKIRRKTVNRERKQMRK
jgi:hypothetical protein